MPLLGRLALSQERERIGRGGVVRMQEHQTGGAELLLNYCTCFMPLVSGLFILILFNSSSGYKVEGFLYNLTH